MINFEHMQKLRAALIRKRGGLAFLALFEREDRRGRWDLLIAGGHLEHRLADYDVVAECMRETLDPEEMVQVTRMVILPEDYEPIVEVRERAQVNGSGPVELRDFDFYQFTIRRAWIFHAEPVEAGAART